MTTLEVVPGTLNLKLYGGDDVPIIVNMINAAGEPATIDGTLKATIYAPYASPTTLNPAVTGGTLGVYTVTFSKAITRAYAGLGDLAWDLQLTNTAGKVRTVLKGIATIAVEVTND